MAKKKNQKERAKEDDFSLSAISTLKAETIHTICAILFFLAAVLLILSSVGKAGLVGRQLFGGLSWLVGVGYFLLPILFIILGVSFLRILRGHFVISKIVSSAIFFLSALGIVNLLTEHRGGALGNLVSSPLIKLFDFTATLVFLAAFALISLLVMLDTHISVDRIKALFGRSAEDEEKRKLAEDSDEEIEAKILPEEEAPAVDSMRKGGAPEAAPLDRTAKIKKIMGLEAAAEADGLAIRTTSYIGKEFTPPPLSLLERDKGKPGVGDIKANANIIKRTLMNFGIDVEMDEISIGPTVTRYALKPAEGVKLSRIVGLQNDLALALAAHPIRIEAPIPGKSLVGIEIPNTTKTMVGLGSLLATEEFQGSEKPLLVALGKGISGKGHFSNVAKMPHLLIAGTTGSGKSVTIHALITSLLYRNAPESMKFIMIDPKRVELTLYNKIPHLLTPVITDPKKAILALKWAAKEMDRRYDILQAESVRDIESYHKTVLAPAMKKYQADIKDGTDIEHKLPETMPYIMIFIDELADIMTSYPRELEAAIVRLAQMSRAVGIHLILSTQRPSVNVITGLIKANVPSRLALQVSSQIDSRTILDMGGAEKLLGAGDMLFLSGDMAQPQRIQSAYITEAEVKSVVKYLVDEYKDELPSEVNMSSAEKEKDAMFEGSLSDDRGGDDDEDDLYDDAKAAVMEAGKASTSYIQRKLRVGYARAARLMDILESRGVIGPSDGAKPREIMGGGSGTGTANPDGGDGAASPQEASGDILQ